MLFGTLWQRVYWSKAAKCHSPPTWSLRLQSKPVICCVYVEEIDPQPSQILLQHWDINHNFTTVDFSLSLTYTSSKQSLINKIIRTEKAIKYIMLIHILLLRKMFYSRRKQYECQWNSYQRRESKRAEFTGQGCLSFLAIHQTYAYFGNPWMMKNVSFQCWKRRVSFQEYSGAF